MGSSGPMTDVAGLIKNSGCDGACLPILAANAWKLFHSATILPGKHGLNSVNASMPSLRPVARGASNISPSYSRIPSFSSTPNPRRSLVGKRAHRFTLQHRLEQRRHFSRVARDLDPALFHDGELLVGRAFPPGNDGAGVTHALTRRCSDARDETHHRFLHVCLDPACASLFIIAADLSHHDHRVGFRVIIEQAHDVHMLQAIDGIAADADAR